MRCCVIYIHKIKNVKDFVDVNGRNELSFRKRN